MAFPLHDDDLVEDDKVYVLTLEAVPGNPVVFVEPSQASLLVRDDDGQSKHQSKRHQFRSTDTSYEQTERERERERETERERQRETERERETERDRDRERERQRQRERQTERERDFKNFEENKVLTCVHEKRPTM